MPNLWDHTEPVRPGVLQYLSVGCTTRCNLACTFCSKEGTERRDLDPELLLSNIRSARSNGLEKVEITGGEPLCYPWFFRIVEEMVDLGLLVLIVSNGTLLDRRMARTLAGLGVGVSISLSTLNPERYDRMARTRGGLSKVHQAIDALREAGYSRDAMPVLAIQTLASRETLAELGALRAWAGEHGCAFILNRPIPVGGLGAKSVLTGQELHSFLGESAEVPFSDNVACNRLEVGCYLGADGIVRPCPAIDVGVGQVGERSVDEIWASSEEIAAWRGVHARLEGACASCPHNRRCYGCRAVAWATFGSRTAPDPGCWRFSP
jgi:radical SAM protein with 4Fe4S-binding SPASM domain